MKGQAYTSKKVDENGLVNWSEAENATWAKLVARQTEVIKNRACDEFVLGLKLLDFSADKIPQLPDVNKVLEECNGWGVEPVSAVIQPKEFFTLLANKRFPAATFIRTPEELDYLQEPDIFHELYGHAPLLTNKAYGDFMEAFGKMALSEEPKDRRRLFRLFWFTIEFGLVATDKGLRAYGGGILSSIGETQYCLEDKVEKIKFTLIDALRTPFRIDIMQPLYFVLDKFEDLFTILDNDIIKLINQAKELGDYAPLFPPKKKSQVEGADEGSMRC
ncbi:MAG: phenylalanine 4-monooxygenase [Halobacteriovoraceae bacterium]|jgi:phenylalanine-4-hydroxylase|nr:phenylalanine 4-monooxygenase [Halobacteriovoraceae bacterium]